VLIADRDGDNPAPAHALAQAEERWLAEGRSVRVVRPPEGFKDFNAWHVAKRAERSLARGGAA